MKRPTARQPQVHQIHYGQPDDEERRGDGGDERPPDDQYASLGRAVAVHDEGEIAAD
jgi:hypothetical protein